MKKDNSTRSRRQFVVCPRCGQSYTSHPAMARDHSGPICPDCGTREALESIGVDAEEQERILAILHRHQA